MTDEERVMDDDPGESEGVPEGHQGSHEDDVSTLGDVIKWLKREFKGNDDKSKDFKDRIVGSIKAMENRLEETQRSVERIMEMMEQQNSQRKDGSQNEVVEKEIEVTRVVKAVEIAQAPGARSYLAAAGGSGSGQGRAGQGRGQEIPGIVGLHQQLDKHRRIQAREALAFTENWANEAGRQGRGSEYIEEGFITARGNGKRQGRKDRDEMSRGRLESHSSQTSDRRTDRQDRAGKARGGDKPPREEGMFAKAKLKIGFKRVSERREQWHRDRVKRMIGQEGEEVDDKEILRRTLMAAAEEFMYSELNMPPEVRERIHIEEAFRPRNKKTNDVLYVRLKDSQSASLLWSQARFFENGRGSSLEKFIPSPAFLRYKAIEAMAYDIRGEDNKRWKTDIRLGKDDFVIRRKERTDTRIWRMIEPELIPDSMPKIDFNDAGPRYYTPESRGRNKYRRESDDEKVESEDEEQQVEERSEAEDANDRVGTTEEVTMEDVDDEEVFISESTKPGGALGPQKRKDAEEGGHNKEGQTIEGSMDNDDRKEDQEDRIVPKSNLAKIRKENKENRRKNSQKAPPVVSSRLPSARGKGPPSVEDLKKDHTILIALASPTGKCQ
jgi:hypothetical protein